MTQLTFKTFLLAAFMDRDKDGRPTEAARLALDLTTGINGTASLDGGALRDYLANRSSENKDWVWGRWNAFSAWHRMADRLPASSPGPLAVYDVGEFLEKKFPACEPLMIHVNHPTTVLFRKRSLAQIFAQRGVGKTWVGAAFARALATGERFLTWRALRPAKVLYVEGEMANEELQQRLRVLDPTHELAAKTRALLGATGGLRLITIESQESASIPPLSEVTGRSAIEEALGDAEVVFFDSISTLAWMATNDEENWIELLAWFNRLRARGLCIIFLHHAGKSGLQRGHSRSEDQLNVSIKLWRRKEDEECEHLKCVLEYDKFRGDRTGVRNLLVELRNGRWSYDTMNEENLKLLAEYLKANPKASNRAIAKDHPEFGSVATIWRLRQRLEGKGKGNEDSEPDEHGV